MDGLLAGLRAVDGAGRLVAGTWAVGVVGLLVAMEMKVEAVWVATGCLGMVLTYFLLILEDTIQVQ